MTFLASNLLLALAHHLAKPGKHVQKEPIDRRRDGPEVRVVDRRSRRPGKPRHPCLRQHGKGFFRLQHPKLLPIAANFQRPLFHRPGNPEMIRRGQREI